MNKKKLVVLLSIIFVIIIAGCGAYYYYFIPNNSIEPAFDESRLNLVIDSEVIESGPGPVISDDQIMLPFNVVSKYLDPTINWDKGAQKVTVTTLSKVVRMKTDNLKAFVNNKPVNLKLPVSVKEDTVYIPIEFLSDLYNININWIKNKNIIIIDYKNKGATTAKPVSPEAVIRRGASIRYPIIENLNTEENKQKELSVINDGAKWVKVRTWDGVIGFIERRFIETTGTTQAETDDKEQVKAPWKPVKGKITAVWDMFYEKRTGGYKEGKIEGLDVISPTWFQVLNDKGDIINRADSKYSDWAHAKGYKVWALLSNDSQNTGMTHRFLTNTDSRDNLIRGILVYAMLYKLDGINIDFENINIDDKGALSQFIREAAPLLREQGLTVSVDVTTVGGSANWSQCYDRKEIGRVADYVMLMGYDQSWPEPGPNSQLSWVEQSIKNTLKEVPKEKLVLGIPTYTRVWKEGKDKSGKAKYLYDSVLTMDNARKLLLDNKADVKWDETFGQFYAEFKKKDVNYKVWLEDSDAVEQKTGLVHKYSIAGVSLWSKSFSNDKTWKVIAQDVKGINDYNAWAVSVKDRKYVFP